MHHHADVLSGCGMLTAVCFWWTDPAVAHKERYNYTARDVEVRRNALRRHLTVPYELVCVTDRPGDVPEGVRAIELDRRVFAPGTRYAKLMLFRRDAARLLGERLFYLDLDAAIVRNIDKTVSRPEKLVMLKNVNYGQPRRTFFDSGMLMLTSGARPDIYEDFDAACDEPRQKDGFSTTDQWWLSERVTQSAPHWDHTDGVLNASLIGGPQLPDDARIVLFPGNRQPSWPQTQKAFPWLKTHYR